MHQVINQASRQGSTVRITGLIDERFVQFEFSAGDPDLTVDLVMQPEQFAAFCKRHNSRLLSDEEGSAVEIERLKWRYGKVGLTR
jgi:phenol hydroxylase P0 protein